MLEAEMDLGRRLRFDGRDDADKNVAPMSKEKKRARHASDGGLEMTVVCLDGCFQSTCFHVLD